MTTIQISDDLKKRLSSIARRTKSSEEHCVNAALEQFLEDQEDYLLAVSRIEKNKGKRNIPLEEIKQRFGLVDEDLED